MVRSYSSTRPSQSSTGGTCTRVRPMRWRLYLLRHLHPPQRSHSSSPPTYLRGWIGRLWIGWIALSSLIYRRLINVNRWYSMDLRGYVLRNLCKYAYIYILLRLVNPLQLILPLKTITHSLSEKFVDDYVVPNLDG